MAIACTSTRTHTHTLLPVVVLMLPLLPVLLIFLSRVAPTEVGGVSWTERANLECDNQ